MRFAAVLTVVLALGSVSAAPPPETGAAKLASIVRCEPARFEAVLVSDTLATRATIRPEDVRNVGRTYRIARGTAAFSQIARLLREADVEPGTASGRFDVRTALRVECRDGSSRDLYFERVFPTSLLPRHPRLLSAGEPFTVEFATVTRLRDIAKNSAGQ